MFKLTENWAILLFYNVSTEFRPARVKFETWWKKQVFSAHPTVHLAGMMTGAVMGVFFGVFSNMFNHFHTVFVSQCWVIKKRCTNCDSLLYTLEQVAQIKLKLMFCLDKIIFDCSNENTLQIT